MDITESVESIIQNNEDCCSTHTTKIFFTSDLHFGHKNIIKYSQRPFADIFEMEAELIAQWNKVVHELDIVFCLGDWTFGSPKRLGSILSALNGHIFAVLGNHDGHKVRKELRHWCVETATEMHLKLPKHPAIIMHHCPWRTWPGQNRGAINLHGHCHSPMPRSYHQRQIDVGVDAWEMRPVSLKTVLALAQQPLGIPAGIPALGYDHYRPSE